MKKLNLLLLSCVVIHSLIIARDETDLFHNFMLANYEQSKGQLEKAHKAYKQLLLTPDTPIHIYKGYLPLLAAIKEHQQIVILMPHLKDHFANDPDIQLIFGQALEYTGKQKEADELFIKLSRQFTTHQGIIYQAVNSYRRNKERTNAIKLIDDLLNNPANSSNRSNNFVFHFMKAQLYTELSDTDNARQSVGTSLKLYPNFDKGWLLFGMLEESAGKLDDAIEGYRKFLELSNTANQQLEKHLLELLIKRHLLNAKQKAITVNDNCFLEGLSLFQKKEYRKGIQSIDKCLRTEPTSKENATIIKINMLSALRKNRKAFRILQDCLYNDPHNEIWYTQLHLLCLNGISAERCMKLLLELTREHPHTSLAHMHLAELYEKRGAHRETIFHYQRALEYVEDIPTKTRIMYNLSCLYSETKDYARMKSLIATILDQSPEFMPAQHLLAYHVLEHEKNPAHAQELLNIAMARDPHNPFYQVTQALIFQAKEQFDRALTTLNQARILTSNPHFIDEQLHTIAHNYITTQLSNTYQV